MKKNKALVTKASHVITIIGERVGNKGKRSIHITGASCIGNTLVGVGKLVMGVLSLSLFTCVSALYTFGMVFAKCCALAGIYKSTSKKEQYGYYLLSGTVLIIGSILYIAYSIRLFFYPEITSYHMYVGIGIAAFTFTELSLNIRGVIIERHNHTPLIHAIKMINLASSLICLVLTQTAILSFADTKNSTVHSQVNGLMGVIMGVCATMLGVGMVLHIRRIKQEKNYGAAYRKVKKLVKKQSIPLQMKPIRYIENEDTVKILYVVLLKKSSQENLDEFQIAVKEKLNLELLCIDNK